MGRGLIIFAFLVTGGLTLLLGLPERASRVELPPIVVSRADAEPVERVDTLRRGEAIAAVLARQELEPEQVAGVVEALRAYTRPRTLRPGVTVAVRRTAWDSLLDLTVRIDADRLVRLRPADGVFESSLAAVPTRVDTLVIAGDIETSLYQSVMDLPGLDMGARERIERLMWGIYRPFQWSIDFGLDLRRGDSYRAVYERHVRPDGSVRSARVLAAEFVNQGLRHRAYWFEPRGEYFDEDGVSMERVFLKAPLDFRRISSRFTRRRYHPVLGRRRAHLGTDYAADRGTPVHTTGDGTVTRAGRWGGYGRIVEIRHINGYRTRYAHLSWIARGIRPGVRVSQSQTIGYVGSTGLATGPHLHYELRHNATAVDPRTVDLPSGEPIGSGRRAEFVRIRDGFDRLLMGPEVTDIRMTE